jgi:hypothetical protein
MKGVIQNVLLFIFLTIVCSQLSAQSKGWAKINKMSGMAQVDDNYNSDPERFKNAIEYLMIA